MTIFLLFTIVLYFGLLLIYTFNVMVITGIAYLCLTPISYIHFIKLNKKFDAIKTENDHHEDML